MTSFDQHKKGGAVPALASEDETGAKKKGGYLGHARKEGAAGRGIDDGSTYMSDPAAAGVHDPNYDSEEETPGDLAHIPKCDDHISLVAYKKRAEAIIMEYFDSGDIEEVARAITETGAPEHAYEFVKRLLSMSMDRTDRDRESVSQLMSALWPNVLSSNMIGKGLERLFELTEEIEKDVPAAKTMMSTFLARAVMDEIVPPSFLSDSVVRQIGGEVVEHAKLLLSRDHAGAKLERCWGAGDGRPAAELKVAVDLVFQEFLLSNDAEEALRCLAELKTPQFFHEVVKRGITAAMDGSADQQAQMSALFASAVARELLSSQQARKGFDRVQGNVADLELDTPAARAILAAFIQRAVSDGVLPSSYVTTCI